MEQAPAKARRLAAFRRRCAFAFGLTAAAGATPTFGQTPAAVLGMPRPMSADARPVARAQAGYTPSVFETFESRARATGQPYPAGQPPAPAGGTMSQVAAVAPVKQKSAFDNTWQGMKELVVGKPTDATIPSAMPQTSAVSQAGPAPQPVISGPPAYRWFGWGTTTPGANPYAPQGQSPQASANWYAQTGATPGAFPVPATNPYRPSPGVEPPQYLAGGSQTYELASPATGMAALPPPATDPVPQQVMVPYPVPGMMPAVGGQPSPLTITPPQDARPIAQSPSFAPASSIELPPPAGLRTPTGREAAPPVIAPPVPAQTSPDIQWQPVSGAIHPGPEITQTGGQTLPGAVVPIVTAAGHDATDIERQVRAACGNVAEVVHIRSTGPGKLTVRLLARTESHARVAADEVSRVPALRGYDVAFEAKFGGR